MAQGNCGYFFGNTNLDSDQGADCGITRQVSPASRISRIVYKAPDFDLSKSEHGCMDKHGFAFSRIGRAVLTTTAPCSRDFCLGA